MTEVLVLPYIHTQTDHHSVHLW